MWSMDAAGTRPFFGDHHAMVVYGRELFVLGGLGGGSGGKVMGAVITCDAIGSQHLQSRCTSLSFAVRLLHFSITVS